MPDLLCTRCHKPIGAADAAFCPFCGEKLQITGPDLSAVLQEADPVKKHNQLLALREQYPESLEVAQEILHLGRLYERGKKGMDFSVIKCFMLNIYLEPDTLKKNKREELRHEIFHHPDLDACLALAEDKEAFLSRYLQRLSEEFIRLFLQGSSRYMHQIFGFVNNAKAPKYLAAPAATMLLNMQRDAALDEHQRTLLTRAFYAAFACRLDDETKYLDDILKPHNLGVETQ